MSRSRDIDVASIGTQLYLKYFFRRYFLVNFHFLKNDKRYNQDFFTIDTIDYGLSFHHIKSRVSSNIFAWYYIPFLQRAAQDAQSLSRISAIE